MSASSFPQYFSTHVYPIKIVAKRDSALMKFIAGLLKVADVLHLSSIGDFMLKYVTTIHNVIYWPAERGEASMRMSPNSTLMHELTHVLLWAHDKSGYDWSYITSDRKRAYYESVCVQAEMLFKPERANMDYVNSRIKFFQGYGIPASVLADTLIARLNEVRAGNPKREAKEVTDAYTAWRSS